MIGLKRKQVGKGNVITDIEYYDFQLEKKAKEKWLKWKRNDEEKKRRTKWISLLSKEKYSTLATIEKPMPSRSPSLSRARTLPLCVSLDLPSSLSRSISGCLPIHARPHTYTHAF